MKRSIAKRFTAAVLSAGLGAASLPVTVSVNAADGEYTQFPYTIQGEDMEGATLWTKIYENETPGYNGEGFTYITGGENSFTVTVPEDGMYTISVRGIQILDQGGRFQTFAVNGVEYSKTVPYYREWTDIDLGVARLKAGENTISFLNKYGYLAIDEVTIAEAEFPDVTVADAVPCDPKATSETKALMKFLHSVYGHGILSGQQEIYGGGHSVSTDIRYDASQDKCIDGKGNEYVIDRDSEDVDKDGNKFYWHCSDDIRSYTYDTQNRCYKYDYYDQEFDDYKEITGEYPAIRGFDFMNYNPLYGWDDGSTERAIEWAKDRNGIVTACWHINLPTDFANYTPGDAVDWSSCSYKNNASFDVANAVIEGTKENEYLDMAIEDLAEQFLKLQEAGVPIMFRPFHEAEGNGGADGSGAWFWWSQNGAEAYKNLYKYLYNALTDTYGLHNIIWMENLYAWSDESAEWYVGDDYIDIVGFDKYDTVYNRHDGKTSGPNEDCNSSVYWALNKYTNGKKMNAIMENSTVPSLANMTTEQATWLYFCTWYDNGQDNFLTGDNYNDPATLHELGSSDYCVNLEDLPADLYVLGGEVDPPVTTAPPIVTAVTTTVTTETDVPGDIIYGDANADGTVDIADATRVLQAIGNADKYGLDAKQAANADCYNPGSGITALDALAIQKLDAKVISSLPEVVLDESEQ